ncbi:MAG: SDR family oxidoreductase [Pseudonocardia sp.]|nr:SDR family oxidoreductase [Pseudonocardia sp.]
MYEVVRRDRAGSSSDLTGPTTGGFARRGVIARKHALVTGASTGIGRATALRLVAEGFHVFAAVRREEDGDALAAGTYGLLTPLIMDVTRPEDIARAVERTTERVGEHGLDLLVNNAGIGVFEPLELVPMERFRAQLEVNVTAQLAVTQAFLPLLRRAGGRIVMMGSVAGRITLPFAGGQAASKRAVQALAEALRQELAPWRLPVILVEPASIRSEDVDKLAVEVRSAPRRFGAAGRALYGGAFTQMTTRAVRLAAHGSSPERVAEVIARVATSYRPRSRYLVGRYALLLAVLALLPAALLDALLRKLFALPEPGAFPLTPPLESIQRRQPA